MRILVPVDGSAASLDAVHHMIDLCDAGLEFDLLLVNVQDNPHLYEVILSADPEVLAGAAREAGEDSLEAAVQLADEGELSYDCAIATGEAGPELVEMAERENCDAIVMGSQGHGLLGGARLGSVCQYVLLHASVPVTIVRHADPDEPDDEPAEGTVPDEPA